jgi:hypothetical protein
MWASQYPDSLPEHFVFPSERCGGKGEEEKFNFTGGVVFYETNPNHPIGDWKEAWEKAKQRAGAVLYGENKSTDDRPRTESQAR